MGNVDMFDAIVNAVEAVAAEAQKREEVNSLRRRARKLECECGSCQHWMKLGACPREKMDNLAGRHRGPSMTALVCGAFKIEEVYKNMAADWRAEADAIVSAVRASTGE